MTRKIDTKTPMRPFDFTDMKKTRYENYYIVELLFTRKAEVIFNYIGVYCSRIWNCALEVHLANFDKGDKKPFNADKMYRLYFNKWKARPGNATILDNVPKEIYIHTLSDLTKSCENAFRIRRKDRLPGLLLKARDRFRLGKSVKLDTDKRLLIFPKIGTLRIQTIYRQSPYVERKDWLTVDKIEGELIRCAVFRVESKWLLGVVTRKSANMGINAQKEIVRRSRKQGNRFKQLIGSNKDTEWIKRQQRDLGDARNQSIIEQKKFVDTRVDYVRDTKK